MRSKTFHPAFVLYFHENGGFDRFFAFNREFMALTSSEDEGENNEKTLYWELKSRILSENIEILSFLTFNSVDSRSWSISEVKLPSIRGSVRDLKSQIEGIYLGHVEQVSALLDWEGVLAKPVLLTLTKSLKFEFKEKKHGKTEEKMIENLMQMGFSREIIENALDNNPMADELFMTEWLTSQKEDSLSREIRVCEYKGDWKKDSLRVLNTVWEGLLRRLTGLKHLQVDNELLAFGETLIEKQENEEGKKKVVLRLKRGKRVFRC